MNLPHRTHIDGHAVPSAQEEYLLYQTLLGVWPFTLQSQAERRDLLQRLQDYMCKALREAKVHTSWVDPQPAYEEAVARFVQAILDERRGQAFLQDFSRMQAWVADYGVWNALAQTLLKLTIPGVPDIYQGCELWDFSLVDPDNRRPVDYAQRQSLLEELQRRVDDAGSDRLALVHELLHHRQDGRVKLYVTWQALTFRRAHAELFLQGTYMPLHIRGRAREHLCAFARVHGNAIVLVLAPRLLTSVMPDSHALPLGEAVWEDTHVVVPEEWGNLAFRHLFTAESIQTRRVGEHLTLPVAVACRSFPVAMLTTLR
jgi:(1->4)-alpha-D-glucan 1-alpha-D-glucosylmutase